MVTQLTYFRGFSTLDGLNFPQILDYSRGLARQLEFAGSPPPIALISVADLLHPQIWHETILQRSTQTVVFVAQATNGVSVFRRAKTFLYIVNRENFQEVRTLTLGRLIGN